MKAFIIPLCTWHIVFRLQRQHETHFILADIRVYHRAVPQVRLDDRLGCCIQMTFFLARAECERTPRIWLHRVCGVWCNLHSAASLPAKSEIVYSWPTPHLDLPLTSNLWYLIAPVHLKPGVKMCLHIGTSTIIWSTYYIIIAAWSEQWTAA